MKKLEEINDKNLIKAQKASVELFKELNKDSINCTTIHLRSIDLFTFDAILVIPENDFLSSKIFDKAHSSSTKIEKNYEKKEFHISFHFMPFSKNINVSALSADGFDYTYGTKK